MNRLLVGGGVVQCVTESVMIDPRIEVGNVCGENKRRRGSKIQCTSLVIRPAHTFVEDSREVGIRCVPIRIDDLSLWRNASALNIGSDLQNEREQICVPKGV